MIHLLYYNYILFICQCFFYGKFMFFIILLFTFLLTSFFPIFYNICGISLDLFLSFLSCFDLKIYKTIHWQIMYGLILSYFLFNFNINRSTNFEFKNFHLYFCVFYYYIIKILALSKYEYNKSKS